MQGSGPDDGSHLVSSLATCPDVDAAADHLEVLRYGYEYNGSLANPSRSALSLRERHRH